MDKDEKIEKSRRIEKIEKIESIKANHVATLNVIHLAAWISCFDLSYG